LKLQHTVQAIIRPGDQSGYVAECHELHAVTQGATLNEVAANLREVVALALDGEDIASLGFVPSPVIVATFELVPDPR
jgi:predicted RNase H-like HicB family nuclease